MSASIRSSIHPTLHYRDAHAAIDWLCAALGFSRRMVHEDGQGGVAHAQLTLGNSLIMLGTHRGQGWGALTAMPDEIGGRETQMCCLTIADDAIDAHYATAVAAGATIIDPLSAKDYGGKGYGCRDPEGHIWWVGSYDPWA